MNGTRTFGSSASLRIGLLWTTGLVLLAGLLSLAALGHFRIAFAVSIVTFLVFASVYRADAGLIASVVFLCLLGELRRILILIDGWPQFDPLLLVGGIVAIAFVASSASRREVVFDTWMSKLIGMLIVVMAIQIFNPAQGSLTVGVSGAMFYIVPLLWYFVARTRVNLALLKLLLLRILVPLGLLAAAFGLYQTFFGYTPYQMQWYYTAGYGSLGPLFALKPLSFFSSSTEHAAFLSVIVVTLVATGIRGQRAAFVVAAIVLVSMFLVGSRGPVVRTVVTVACIWAILSPSRSVWVVRIMVGVVIGFAGLYWSSTQVSKIGADGAVGFYIERQTGAFMNPLDKKESTAQLHGAMFVNGIIRGFSNPLGRGLGSTTKAAAKFDAEGHSSEVDLSNVFLSTGFVGGLMYLAILILIAHAGVICWQHDRSLLMLCVVGALVVTAGGYLHGGRYFLSTLLWIVIGALDRHYADIVHGRAD